MFPPDDETLDDVLLGIALETERDANGCTIRRLENEVDDLRDLVRKLSATIVRHRARWRRTLWLFGAAALVIAGQWVAIWRMW